MSSNSLKSGIERIFGGVILSVVIPLIYLALSALFVRHGDGFAGVVRYNNFDYLFLLAWVPVAAFLVGIVLGLDRSTYLLGTIFGTNKTTSRLVTFVCWFLLVASYWLFFYQN